MDDDGSAEDEPIRKLRIASRLFAYSEGTMRIMDAMKVAGYGTPERQPGTIYQRVRRAGNALRQSRDDPPPALVLVGNSQNDSSISSASISNIVVDSSVNSIPSEATGESIAPKMKETQKRRRPKDKQLEDAVWLRRRRSEVNVIKLATKNIQYSRNLPRDHPEKKSDISIVRSLNEMHSCNVSVKTASMMVREGRIGVSPIPKGPTGFISSQIWDVLKGAFVSYINLEQAHASKQSSMRVLSLKINKCLNRAGYTRKDQYFVRKLRKETADRLDIGDKNVMEDRRSKWTTFTNLNLWFSTWEQLLIDLGFGRKKRDGEQGEGSVVFFEGQTDRIVNLDETDGSMDNTNGQRGGRPNFVFYSDIISGGASRANKTSYCPTLIGGSTGSGDPLPLHFQLKTMAQSDATEKVHIDFFRFAKDTYGKFGHPTRRYFPCTWGMNEKAGMNSVELEKYFMNSILPLYPDVEDRPRKRYVGHSFFSFRRFVTHLFILFHLNTGSL